MAKVLLQLNNIHKAYGAHVIFDDAGASFMENQKIGVIGRNGAGKSTLCKIITGHEEADGGTIAKSQELRLSYLEQHDPYKLDETVISFLMRYTGKEEWECGKVAGQFQMKGDMLEAKIGALSGGYRTRVKLTAMLLTDPNFLILDEPTNYLDLKTLILLEEFLQEYEGAFLIVSHDREFLKKTCEHTLEVENGEMTLYPGSVNEYLMFKEDQKQQALSTNKNIEAKKKQLQDFVTRFGAKASKASQAKSKMKQIEKLSSKTIEVGHALSNVHIRIPAVEKRNGIAMSTQGLAIGYPEKLVAQKIDLEVMQGQHVAVLGDNGQGKTTFLRTLAEDLTPKAGGYKWGHNLKIAYYAQHVFTTLHPEQDVYTHLAEKAADGVGRQEILNLAGSFLFKGDDVKKKVKVLSGGERARAVLAGLLLSKSQVILLDEPTNHLDFETVEALGRALKTFSGTIFFISHDRTFVNLVATEIIEVGGGRVVRYPGTYEDYVYHLENRLRTEVHTGIYEDEVLPAGNSEKETPKASKSAPVSVYEQKKNLESERKKLTTRLKKIEELLESHKAEKELTEKEFLEDPSTWSPLRNKRLVSLGQMIEEEEKNWLELVEKIEAMNAQITTLGP